MNFETLGLSAPLLRALAACGYEQPTPIQEQAIPPALAGRDVLGCAQTGTGKTCAFGTPILQRLAATPRKGHKGVRALILTPTRELALQIQENLKEYSRYLPLKTAVIFGGVGQAPQVEQLRRGVDILTATPGRLLDLSQQGLIDLKHLEVLVLDEADRMLDMGFIHDVRRILALLPKEKQTLFFSATMPVEITDLVNSLLKDPVKVAVDPVSSPVEVIHQRLYLVDRKNKSSLLADILRTDAVSSALVFTRTKHGADRVTKELLRAGITAAAIHGNKSQTARQAALSEFKKGKLQVLVATDIAARGIDIDELAYVVNYNMPDVPETYVHRIGRTGRAGRGGTAISFCDHAEETLLRMVERLLGRGIERVENHDYPMEDFEEIRRDKRGRVVNLDDEEARTAAREKRMEKQKAEKTPDKKMDKKPVVAKGAGHRQGGQPVVGQGPKRGRRPQGQPGAPLPAHPAERPEEVLRRNPLEGDAIMDATARMFAKRAPKVAGHQGKGGGRGREATPGHGGRPTPQRVDASPATGEVNREKRRNPKEKPGIAATVIGEKTAQKAAPRQAAGGGFGKEGRGHGNRRRIPVVEGPRSRQKDSTEQPSLMKPFYLEHD